MPRYAMNRLNSRVCQNAGATAPVINDQGYGKPQDFNESEGRIVDVEYGLGNSAERVRYFVPRDACWTAGAGAIQIDTAFRVIEGHGKKSIREVRNPSELESVAICMVEEVQKVLSRLKK